MDWSASGSEERREKERDGATAAEIRTTGKRERRGLEDEEELYGIGNGIIPFVARSTCVECSHHDATVLHEVYHPYSERNL